MAEKVGGLLIELSANVARLQSDMNQAVGHVKRASDQMSTAASFARGALEAIGAGLSIRAFVGFIKDTADAADQLGKLSQKTGITVENLSALQYAGKLSDVSMESLGQALKSLSKNIDEGDKNFERIGISLESIKGKSPDKVLALIADKYAVMEDGAGKAANANALLGKSGSDLIPLLNQGSAGLKQMADEAGRLGAIVSTESAAAAEQFNDNITKLQTSLRAMGVTLVNQVIPDLTTFTTQVLAAQKVTGSWLQAIKNSMSPVSEQIVDLEANLAKLQARRNQFATQGTFRKGVGWFIGEESLDSLDQAISNIRTKIEVLYNIRNEMLRQERAADEPSKRTGKAPTPLDQEADARRRKALADAERLANEIEAFNRQVDSAQDASIASRMRTLDGLADDEKKRARDQIELDREVMEWNKMVDEEQKKSMEASQRNYDELAKAAKDAAKDMIQAIEGFGRSTSKVFAQALVDGKFTSDSLSSMFKTFFAEIIEQQLYKGVFGPVFNAVGTSLFSALGGGNATAGFGYFGGGKASGGPVSGMTPYLVGEKGPELFMPGSSGTIVPNGQLGGGSVTIVQNIRVGSDVSHQEVNGAMKMAAARAKAEIMQSYNRNGSFARTNR